MNKKNHEIEELAVQPMFAKRKDLKEAFTYAQSISKSLDKPDDSTAYVYMETALMVIWNTLAENYEPLVKKKVKDGVK